MAALFLLRLYKPRTKFKQSFLSQSAGKFAWFERETKENKKSERYLEPQFCLEMETSAVAGDQDQQWLLNCLSATLDPNQEVRSFAEASLNQASFQPGLSLSSFYSGLNVDY